MEDLSTFLKKGFQKLQEKPSLKEYKQKTINDRRENCTNLRRSTRDTLKWQNRNININCLSPFYTPEQERNTKFLKAVPDTKTIMTTKEAPTNKRLDRLKQWKIEKAQKKLDEKKNAKPVFKVFHVPISVGLPDLENVNKEIKGKAIKKHNASITKFAPENHKFRPPGNIRPLQFKNSANFNADGIKKKLEFKIKNATTSSEAATENVGQVRGRKIQEPLKKNNIIREKPIKTITPTKTRAPERTSKVQNGYKPVSATKQVSAKNSSRNIQEKTPKKTKVMLNKSSQNDRKPKKNVMWNVIEIIESDDEILVQEINAKSPRRKYSKTPIKKRPVQDSDSDEVLSNDKKTGIRKTSLKKDTARKSIIQTPIESSNKIIKYNGSSKQITGFRKSVNKISNNDEKQKESKKFKNIVPQDEIHINSQKLNKRQSYNDIPVQSCSSTDDDDDVLRKDNGEPHKNLLSSTDTSDEDFIASRKMRPSTSYEESPQKTLQDSIKQDVQRNKKNNGKNVSHEKAIFYSDEELTMKTPIKKTATSKYWEKAVLKSAEKRFSTSTPLRTNSNKPSEVYVSPFVTISRGKESARKEYQMRSLNGGSMPDSASTSPAVGAAYFSKQLDDQVDRIESLRSEWIVIKQEIPEDVQCMVDAAIGQSTLLISKKFQQFRKLIRMCEEGVKDCDKPVTCTDLHGYWDTMYMQIEDIDKRFNNLQRLKNNDWKEVLIPEKKPAATRPKPRAKKIAAQSKIRDMIKNARMRKNNPSIEVENVVPSSIPSEIVPQPSPRSQQRSTKQRQSLRVSIIAKESAKRLSSPGLTILKISQAIKSGNGLTPNKSILKTDHNKSERKITKSVLFKDLAEDKENSLDGVTLFSPKATRRSSRSSKV